MLFRSINAINIVAFFELSGNHKKLRSQAPRLYGLTIFIAFISAYARYFFTLQYQIPLIITIIHGDNQTQQVGIDRYGNTHNLVKIFEQ